jgi:hypothetical protein
VSLSLFLQGLGSIGIFASRAFLPAFVTALLLRLGPHVPWLAHAGLIPHLRDVPTWFTSHASLVVLGVLSALELVAERFPEAAGILAEVHDYLKTGMAVLTYLGVLNATESAAARQVINEAGLVDWLPALAVGAGVYLATQVRGAPLGPLAEADQDDDLGLQVAFQWVPVAGGLAIPAMALINYVAYRSAYRKLALGT